MPFGIRIGRSVASRYRSTRSGPRRSSRSRRRHDPDSGGGGGGRYSLPAAMDKETAIQWLQYVAADKGPAGEAYEYAHDMAGNEGQTAILNKMGMGPWREAAEWVRFAGGDPLEILQDRCPHPEAVEQILWESAYLLETLVQDRMAG